MNRRTRWIVLAILVTLTLSASPHGYSEDLPVIRYKLGHVYQPDHAYTKGIKRLIERIKDKTDGNFIINDYPAGQLGSDKDLFDSVYGNVIEMAILAAGDIARRYNPMYIFDCPFLFRDPQHALKFRDSNLAKTMFAEAEVAARIKPLHALYYGTRCITSKKPITTPEDIKGMKLRTPDLELFVASFRAMGANPTPMALSEVYLALQQNVVDGQENPVPTIHSQKFHEVQTHLAKSGHIVVLNFLSISPRAWAKLPAGYQQAVMEAIAEIGPTIDADIIRDEEELLAEMQKAGMVITEVDKQAFRQATRIVLDEYATKWGEGLYEKIQEIK